MNLQKVANPKSIVGGKNVTLYEATLKSAQDLTITEFNLTDLKA